MTTLTDKQIAWLVRQVVTKGRLPKEIHTVYGVSVRRVQQLVKAYRDTGTMPTLVRTRRPKTPLTAEQQQLIRDAAAESKLSGAVSLRLYIKRHHNTTLPRNKIHQFLLHAGISKPDKKKQKQRKYCRYERNHSFSLVHLDWHESKIIPGKHVCAVEDDASRKILSGGEYDTATSDHSITLMQQASTHVKTHYASTIRQANTDRGSQFYSNTKDKHGNKTLSAFEHFLIHEGIQHIPSRRNHPQTNGKKERWFRTYEEKRGEFATFNDFITWYNNRIHLGLSRTEGITPNDAVLAKLRPESLLGLCWRRWQQ